MLILAVFLLPLFCDKMSICNLPDTLPVTSLVAYVHVGVWFLFLLLHLYVREQHNISRRYGYGMFYRRTLFLRRMTFYVMSIGLFSFVSLEVTVVCVINSIMLSLLIMATDLYKVCESHYVLN